MGYRILVDKLKKCTESSLHSGKVMHCKNEFRTFDLESLESLFYVHVYSCEEEKLKKMFTMNSIMVGNICICIF